LKFKKPPLKPPPRKKSVLDSPHFMKIMKSGKPTDPNRQCTSVNITEEAFDKLWKKVEANRANSVYG
jgi:hypothetical protein